MKQVKDRRVQYTKMVLRESLLDLLKSKTLNEISVSELCNTADINRNTFYNHYRFPKEILQEMEDKIYSELIDGIKDKNSVEEIIFTACKLLERDKKMSELIFSKTDTTNVLVRVLTSVKNKRLKEQKNASVASNFTREFSEKGTVGVIQYWVLNGFKEPAETVASLIAKSVKKVNG